MTKPTIDNIKEQLRDNLFSANHRSAMIDRYGYTEAMTITIEELENGHSQEQE